MKTNAQLVATCLVKYFAFACAAVAVAAVVAAVVQSGGGSGGGGGAKWCSTVMLQSNLGLRSFEC